MNDVDASKATLKSSEIAFKTQEKAFEIIQEQFKNGNITNFEFLEGKSKLTQNTAAYIKAKYELIFKRKILDFYFSVK